MKNIDPEDITKDTFYQGAVTAYQHKKGYRFSIDAPLLADFLPDIPGQEAMEIGTGCGIISLLALYKNKFSLIYGVEVQKKLGRLAEINGEINGLSHRFKVIRADFTGPAFSTGKSGGRVKCHDEEISRHPGEPHIDNNLTGIRHIFSNPPFLKTGIGRLSPDKETRDAKFETKLNLRALLIKSYSILGGTGSLYLIFPYSRFAELERLARDTGYYISRVRFIFSFKDGKPGRFLVQLTNYQVSPAYLEPLVIFEEIGRYTEEMENIFAGR